MQTLELRLDQDHAGSGERVYLRLVLALALLLRLGTAGAMLLQLPADWLSLAAPDLAHMAQSISLGRGMASPFGGATGPTALVTPGYPAVIALIFHWFGTFGRVSAGAVMLLQTVFAVLTIMVMMQVAGRLFGARTANLAGSFWAVSFPLLWMPEIFWSTALSALLVVVMMALALKAAATPTIRIWLIIGVFCGAVLWVDPALLLVMCVIFGWAAWQQPPATRWRPFVALIVMVGLFAPWSVRNLRVLHRFIPVRSSFGYELWQGNRAGADGYFDTSLYPTQNRQEYARYASEGELIFMREKTTLATTYIRSHPGEFLRVTGKRIFRFWAGTGDRQNSVWIVLHIAITTGAGLLGLVALFSERRSLALLFLLPLLVFPLPYYLTDIKDRYRLEIDPLLTILGAYAVTRLVDRSRAGVMRMPAAKR